LYKYSHIKQTKVMKTDKFVSGVSILLLSGIVAKALGAVFRIPLTWVLGIDGLGLYQLIYPVFALLIVLSSSGMPTAVSKLVASKVGAGNYIGAKQVLKVACLFFSFVSLVFSIGLFILAEKIASIQGNYLSMWGYRAVAPAIFIVSFLSCLRGYFQGLSNMVPTALSQIIEQGGKLVLGLALAWAFLPYGVEYATSGALLGVTLSEIFATIALWILYLKCPPQNVGARGKFKVVLGELIVVAFPIVVSSVILPVLTFVDSFLVVNLLLNSFPVDVSTKLWGVSSGVVTSLINFPIALSLSVAVSIVPALVGEKIQERVELMSRAYELIFLFALPAMIFLCVLSESVIISLYGSSFVLEDKTLLAVRMLCYTAPIVVLGSVLQTQTTSLQAIGLGKLALISILCAGVIKILLTFWLVAIPELNIWGFTIANYAFYIIAVGIDAIYLYKKVGFCGYFVGSKKIFAGIAMLTLILLNVNLLVLPSVVKVILGLGIGGVGYLFSLVVFGLDVRKFNIKLSRINLKSLDKT